MNGGHGNLGLGRRQAAAKGLVFEAAVKIDDYIVEKPQAGMRTRPQSDEFSSEPQPPPQTPQAR